MKENAYKVTKFETPIKKSYKEVEKYDIARFEYGDYDNWVDAIILDINIKEESFGGSKPVKVAEIHFAYTFGDYEETCYSNVYDDKLDFDIVGKAERIIKEKIEEKQEDAPLM